MLQKYSFGFFCSWLSSGYAVSFPFPFCSGKEEEDLRPFRIHAYSKEELAMLYNPTYCISNAIYTLAAWIRHNKALKGELEKVGYNKYRRTFTPLEVKVLVKYLGEP